MGVVTLDQVENQIARGFRYLQFSPEIEALFRKEYAAERVRLAVIWGVIGVFIYDLVYFGDRTMLPDVFNELLVARFLVFTPFVIGCILAVRRWPNALLYDVLAVAIAVLGVTLPMAAATQSASSYLFVYQNGNSAAFLFFVIALRPRFFAVVIGLALMCASHFTTTRLTGAFDDVTYSGIITFYLTLSIFLAVSAYFLEQKDRQNFLNQLRGSLLYRQLERNAERDELTGLLNRRSLARVGEMLWNDAPRLAPVSAILLDIDHFKRFNDVHGHIEGDACIRAVARCMRDTVDDASFVFRFGGEEMLVLAADREPLQALAMAERIRTAIERLDIAHRGLGNGCVTASLGVAAALATETTLEKLLQKADAALYEAKHMGRNTVALASAPKAGAQVA
ncbi:GGDEF domain-containing protein [Sinorhizobium sp. NFACC03]|uniref:GGDEF domain-containing protein n=1 Tax=Sinorhizobium sp. NFACC03 TaxID=1566295 RepID=UPI000881700F|nr:GGDEF domain-containing protein [Sinorhizobium sp. NFACC03]SDA58141.1 diguanylate cyclase (GGDEF) domain-containing protein [Sinorhizobium sp. NFACC03]